MTEHIVTLLWGPLHYSLDFAVYRELGGPDPGMLISSM